MNSGGGSSESTSYGYLPYVSPGNANIIGQYQANAANEAAQIAQQQLSAAMAAINNNFSSARTALNPYSQQGVQATNKLNQYLGLDAYNPGAAPTAPTAYVPTETDIRNYLGQNTNFSFAGKDNNIYANYEGAGTKYDGWSRTQLNNGQATGANLVGYLGAADPRAINAPNAANLPTTRQGIIDKLYNDQSIRNAVTATVAQQYADNKKDLIAAEQKQYEQDLANYNQNLAWYNQYKAEGPKTAAQINEEIVNQPGYQAQLNEGIGAVQKAASARGLLGSGNMLKDLTSFAGSLSGEYYQNMLGHLQQQAAVGANAANQVAGSYQNQGGALASLRQNLSDTLGNAALARGNALSQAWQLGNTQYNKVVTGQSSMQQGGRGLSGLGSILGSLASFAKGGF